MEGVAISRYRNFRTIQSVALTRGAVGNGSVFDVCVRTASICPHAQCDYIAESHGPTDNQDKHRLELTIKLMNLHMSTHAIAPAARGERGTAK